MRFRMSTPPFQRLDHIAIIVRDTDEALKFYRDKLGLPLLFSQVMPDAPVRLTHLDAGGGVHLQLVQPLSAEHPLHAWLEKNGEGLQHLCFKVDNVADSMGTLPALGLAAGHKAPRCGPNGRASAFLDLAGTRGVQFEITSDPSKV
jgi:methylmalonyl-CoA/ethylmalonyl-CoA epimerase